MCKKDHSAHSSRRSIFVGLKRIDLKTIDFDRALASGQAVHIPCRWLNSYTLIKGIVAEVRTFADGRLIVLRSMAQSMLENWPEVPIWIPTNTREAAGVLTVWTSNSGR